MNRIDEHLVQGRWSGQEPELRERYASFSLMACTFVVLWKLDLTTRCRMEDMIGDRIRVIFNELLTMNHAPLAAHPNIVNLLGIGFETEGPSDAQNAMPVLIPECAELGNLAEILETARKEDRPLTFDEKISLCLDTAHGLEILHACGQSIAVLGTWWQEPNFLHFPFIRSPFTLGICRIDNPISAQVIPCRSFCSLSVN